MALSISNFADSAAWVPPTGLENEGAGASSGESRGLQVQPLSSEECEGTPVPDTQVWSSRSRSDLEVEVERPSHMNAGERLRASGVALPSG